MKAYLALYNLVSAAGWAYVLFLASTAVQEGLAPAQGWARFGQTLLVVQTLACAEIFHSLFKLVKSPVFTVAMQVFSRLCVMWVFTYVYTAAQTHWSVYLMVISWSLVEVPRYLFYTVNLYSENVPFPLFWLRYSLFAILYPTGISGELLQIYSSLATIRATSIPMWYITIFLLGLYLPGGPFMFFHMMSQRKKSFKARKEKGAPPPPSKGVDFPLDKKTNTRSTTIVNQGAIAASIAKVDPEASAAAAKEKNWRFGYTKHFVKNVELCCTSEAQCLEIAKTGLDYLHTNFEFVLPDGKGSISVMEAMKKIPGTFHTMEIQGTKARAADFEFSVPYQKFGSNDITSLKGQALIEQLNKWVQRGVIEADARDAIANMVKKPEFHSTDLKDKYFVLLGAGSAMGPLRVLLELGANVIAVDIDRDFVWKRLVELARNSPGKMIIPLKKPASEIKNDEDLFKSAGGDLLNDTPKICNWIKSLVPGKQLILGGYAYLDSALFVRLAIAMDAIMAGVLAERPNAALAFLCSPTDVFVTDDACNDAQKGALSRIPLWQKLLKLVLPKNMLVKNAIKQVKGSDGQTFSIVDGLAVAQGPNYALAKRLQHWRCMLARAAGHAVSTNIAPSTATASVVHNPQFAAAYIGMGFFKPMEIVYQDLSNSVMTALLLNDICNPVSAAQPTTNIKNQIRLFSKTSCHFGIWRMAFKCGSIGEVSALIGYAKIYSAYLGVAVLALASVVGVIVQQGAPHTWF